jgi:serine/threonine-protein kinase
MTAEGIADAFGKYQLIAELGRGGMADVFLAVVRGPAGFTKLVVVKKVRASIAHDPAFVEMLLDEARIAARLNHPNIVQTHEVGELDGRHFIAMEYLEGQPLNRLMRRAREGAIDRQLLYKVLADVAGGLHYAHELSDFEGTPLGIVHRDVTPQNVFVTYGGQVKVVDFGIAKAAGRRSAETEAGSIKGKITYMAPEQATGRAVDARTDVFSVGVMLYEVATGARMWKDRDEIAILTALAMGEGPPRSPREVDPEVPEGIDHICRRALAPNPADRYANAAELQSAIEEYLVSISSKVSQRALGEAISNLFQRDRDKLRDLIRSRIADVGRRPPGRIILSLPPESSDTWSTSKHNGQVNILEHTVTRVTSPSYEVSLGVASNTKARGEASTPRRVGRPFMGGLAFLALLALVGAGFMLFSRLRKPPAVPLQLAVTTATSAAVPSALPSESSEPAPVIKPPASVSAAPTPAPPNTARAASWTVVPTPRGTRAAIVPGVVTAPATNVTAITRPTTPIAIPPEDDGISTRK